MLVSQSARNVCYAAPLSGEGSLGEFGVGPGNGDGEFGVWVLEMEKEWVLLVEQCRQWNEKVAG